MLPGIPFRYGARGLNSLLADGNTAARYRANAGVTGALNVSQWDDQSGNGRHLTQGTGANQPIYLSFAGSKYAWLPGVAGNTLTSPTKTLTGNFTITLDIALNDYTTQQVLVDKTLVWDGAQVLFMASGKVRLNILDGATITNVDSANATSFTAGSRNTLRIVWEDGVGASFFANDVSLGAQTPAAKTLTNAVTPIIVGSSSTLGKVYRFQLGSLYDMNPTNSVETTTNGATFTGGQGETWTLNNTGAKPAQIVGSPQLLGDGTNHFMTTTFSLSQPVTAYVVAARITNQVGARLMDGPSVNSMSWYWTSIGGAQYALNAGTAFNSGQNSTLGVHDVLMAGWNGSSSFIKVGSGAKATGNAGTQTNGGSFTFWANGGPGNLSNFQIKEIILRNSADSAATELAIYQRLRQIHGTP